MPRTVVMHRFFPILLLLSLVAPIADVQAQDVEMLGERYGTPVPDGYLRLRGADAGAFEFRRAWRGSIADVAYFEGAARGPALDLGPRPTPVVGDYRIPVLLGLFNNSPATPPFPQAEIQDRYFGGAPGSISDYYSEVSGGRVDLIGDVSNWLRTLRPDTAYTVGESGLSSGVLGGGGAGNFVYELVESADAGGGVDWGDYDNDGPDGVPNSGDDDGFVDVLAVLQPNRGAECGGPGRDDRIWSHRWSLSEAVNATYVTSTPRSGGGLIRVDDYTIQATAACSGPDLNEIGVFTHELGHAFGLPDLYDTESSGGSHSGAGIWDLMASGSWGCNNASPESPCHMGAWTKAALGWVDVVTLAPGVDHGTITLEPVETGGAIYRIDAQDGSGEYYLLENRQRLGYDTDLYSEGVLIWHIDPDLVATLWADNDVNALEHMGVWLRQADGRDDLGVGRGRGDEGDPFPGVTDNRGFHAASTPAATSYVGDFSGVTVFDIGPAGGDDMSARVVTRLSTLTVRAESASGGSGLLTVDSATVASGSTTFTSPPFVTHVLEAAAGDSIAPGSRRPFTGWDDDPSAQARRTITTPIADAAFVAAYGGVQYRLSVGGTGGVNGVEPGVFDTEPPSPGFWFDQDSSVDLYAHPTVGFAFSGWGAPLTGQGNPATLVMDTPRTVDAEFELVYAIDETTVAVPAATALEVQLQVESGTLPVTWRVTSGALPTGVVMGSDGVLRGASLETGVFPVALEAVDAIGLPASGTVTLDVGEPQIPIDQLTSTFLLSGPPLSDAQINYLNIEGNGTAPYDIGDFRAWLLRHPELPLSADLGATVHRRTVTIGSVRDGGGGGR